MPIVAGKVVFKPVLYTLPHGIEVISEYPPGGNSEYWRLLVRPHPLMAGKVRPGGSVIISRPRVLLTVKLGRKLMADEYVHHVNEIKTDDREENLEMVLAGDHSRHHNSGVVQSAEARRKKSERLKGQKRTPEARRNISEGKKRYHANLAEARATEAIK